MTPDLEGYIPEAYLPWCIELWEANPFSFKLTRERKSKLGDYRFRPGKNTHTITINKTLNPWSFLITYLHEYAHLLVHENYPPHRRHHGKEWKDEFRKLLLSCIYIGQLPKDIMKVLANYAKNPKASSYSDPQLIRVLSNYDENIKEESPDSLFLLDLEPNQLFVFREKEYRFIRKKRTRVLVELTKNRKKYLISGHAKVKRVVKSQFGFPL